MNEETRSMPRHSELPALTVVFELCSAYSEFQPLFDLCAFICTDTVCSSLGKASVLLSNPLQGFLWQPDIT